MSRGLVSRSTKLTLLGIAVALAFDSGLANAYMTSPGAGVGDSRVGSLQAPTLATPTAEAGTVTLSWSLVSPPVGSDTVSYYLTRDGGAPAGTCGTSASPTPATSCTDSGLSAGPHEYTVTAVWRSWTATSNQQEATLASGALDHFALVPETSSPKAGQPDDLTITAQDSADHTVTTYTGDESLTFTGASAMDAFLPTVTDKNGNAVAFGTPETIAFSSGVAQASGSSNSLMTLYKTGSWTITVSDGTHSGSSPVTVSDAGISSLLVDNPGLQVTGAPFRIEVTARDAYGNPASSYRGTECAVFSGAANGPNGELPAYPMQAGCPSGENSVIFSRGRATPEVTLYAAGTANLMLTEPDSSSAGSTGNFTVTPATLAPSKVSYPGPQTATGVNVTAAVYRERPLR